MEGSLCREYFLARDLYATTVYGLC